MEIAQELANKTQETGSEHVICADYPLPAGLLEGFDAACVIGGDGTLLGIVPQAVAYGVKVLGVNLGKLGFLVTFSPEAIQEEFTSIMNGDFDLEKRNILCAKTADEQSMICLNDVVIKQTQVNRMMSLRVQADDDLVNRYDCDGLIFATPTGSTAYNLSAGGPILHPSLAGLAMTPICPHTLSNRTVLFPHPIKLTVDSEDQECSPQITLDGQPRFANATPFPLTIEVPGECIELVHGKEYSHFATIRQKLGWRERSI